MPSAFIVGGTGLISTGIVKHLLARGFDVTVFNRGLTSKVLAPGVRLIQGDRQNEAELTRAVERERFDVIFDMICYSPEQADQSVRVFGGRCRHFVFCSSAAVYGPKMPRHVLIDETCPLEPVNPYGKAKILCEQIVTRAAERGAFEVTLARPGHTYGPGDALDDQQERDSGTWDRVARGLPVFCAGDGLGLWTPTHRDDCGKFFAWAALSPRTYGETFNAMSDEVMTWRQYYREVARALDTRAKLIFVPASWLIAQAPERFESLADMTRFHGAYSSAKAQAAVPEFRATIGLEAGARETFADMRRRGVWRDSAPDTAYQAMVDRALALGFPIEEA